MTLTGTAAMIVERDRVLLTDDGVPLSADVYRPDVGYPVPCVLTRTPYDKSRAVTVAAGLDHERAVAAGLAVVCQDVRGRFASGGRFEPFRHEARDGVATVNWVADQQWCSGRVGMAGRSYAAATQWLAAAAGAEPLQALCPIVGASDPYSGAAYQGGAFQLGANLFWAHLIMSLGRSRAEVRKAYHELPLQGLDLFRGTPADFYYDWLAHPDRDRYWEEISVDCQVPGRLAVLNVGGWFDPFLRGTLDNFAARHARIPEQRLLVGPWGHGGAWGRYPDHVVTGMPGSDIDVTGIALDFFREQLLDPFERAEQQPHGPSPAPRHAAGERYPVELYVMGDRPRWVGAHAWPPPGCQPEPWYLRSEAILAPEPPGSEDPDCFSYDPVDPAPTVGGPLMMPAATLGSNFGPVDRALVENRPDVLVYTSAALTEPLHVIGPLGAVLFADTTAADTDFVVALSVVDEQGVSRILAEGIRRARYRVGFQSPTPVHPGEVMRLEIDLVATSVLLRAGQRIRVTVSSSSFPRFDRNLNTGGSQATESLENAVIAHQTIRHDALHPSHIRLPILASAPGGVS